MAAKQFRDPTVRQRGSREIDGWTRDLDDEAFIVGIKDVEG